MSEWSRRASRDIDGKTERSNGREHMSQCGQGASFKRLLPRRRATLDSKICNRWRRPRFASTPKALAQL
jgi:hypothetical protein